MVWQDDKQSIDMVSLEDDQELYAYLRNGADEKLLVINNFYGKETEFQLPDDIDIEGYDAKVLISNDTDLPESIIDHQQFFIRSVSQIRVKLLIVFQYELIIAGCNDIEFLAELIQLFIMVENRIRIVERFFCVDFFVVCLTFII